MITSPGTRIIVGGFAISVLLLVGTFLVPRAALAPVDAVDSVGNKQVSVTLYSSEELVVYSPDKTVKCTDARDISVVPVTQLTSPFFIGPRDFQGKTYYPVGTAAGYTAGISRVITCATAGSLTISIARFVTDTNVAIARGLGVLCAVIFGLTFIGDRRS